MSFTDAGGICIATECIFAVHTDIQRLRYGLFGKLYRTRTGLKTSPQRLEERRGGRGQVTAVVLLPAEARDPKHAIAGRSRGNKRGQITSRTALQARMNRR